MALPLIQLYKENASSEIINSIVPRASSSVSSSSSLCFMSFQIWFKNVIPSVIFPLDSVYNLSQTASHSFPYLRGKNTGAIGAQICE